MIALPLSDPRIWRSIMAPGSCLPLYESASFAIFEDAIGYVPEAATEAAYADRVDEENGVIRGVKILGLQSRNTVRTIGGTWEEFGEALDDFYSYSLEALRDAIPLFEGIKVVINHPEFNYSKDGRRSAAPADREAEDVFGRLVNVRAEGDGLYADHQYLKSHPFARRYVEIARRMPNVLAFSPAANGLPQLVGGKPVIVKITDARSVDLVGERPGTTSSLFESEAPTMADQEALIDKPCDTVEAEMPPMTAGAVDDSVTETELPAADDAADHFDAAFEKEVVGIWGGPGTPQEKAKKIAALAKQQQQIAEIRGKADAETDDDDDEDDEVGIEETAGTSNDNGASEAERLTPGKTVAETEAVPGDDAAKKMAQLKESAARLVRKVRKEAQKSADERIASREAAIFESVNLLNEAGAPVRALHVKAMANLGSLKERQQYVAQCVGKRQVAQPRSQGPAAAPLHETAGRGAPSEKERQEKIRALKGEELAAFVRTGQLN